MKAIWKGTVVAGDANREAAWTYPETKEAADHIRGYVAFWKRVEVTE